MEEFSEERVSLLRRASRETYSLNLERATSDSWSFWAEAGLRVKLRSMFVVAFVVAVGMVVVVVAGDALWGWTRTCRTEHHRSMSYHHLVSLENRVNGLCFPHP